MYGRIRLVMGFFAVMALALAPAASARGFWGIGDGKPGVLGIGDHKPGVLGIGGGNGVWGIGDGKPGALGIGDGKPGVLGVNLEENSTQRQARLRRERAERRTAARAHRRRVRSTASR